MNAKKFYAILLIISYFICLLALFHPVIKSVKEHPDFDSLMKSVAYIDTYATISINKKPLSTMRYFLSGWVTHINPMDNKNYKITIGTAAHGVDPEHLTSELAENNNFPSGFEVSYRYTVRFQNEEPIEASINSIDKNKDYAQLIITDSQVRYAIKTAKAFPHIGDRIWLLSNPKGLRWQVDQGVISNLDPSEKDGYPAFAANNWIASLFPTTGPGSSGGPCINEDSEVIAEFYGTISQNDYQEEMLNPLVFNK